MRRSYRSTRVNTATSLRSRLGSHSVKTGREGKATKHKVNSVCCCFSRRRRTWTRAAFSTILNEKNTFIAVKSPRRSPPSHFRRLPFHSFPLEHRSTWFPVREENVGKYRAKRVKVWWGKAAKRATTDRFELSTSRSTIGSNSRTL
jgi:hypothetical protein